MSDSPYSPAAQVTTIAWYRSPLESKDFKSLHQRNDFKATIQTLGYLGLIILTGGSAFYSSEHWPLAVTIVLIFLHGTVCSFLINAVHELGHGTVFKTKFFNEFFVRIFAFLGFINFEKFHTSHARHHRYTLHPPDDLEVVLSPMKMTLTQQLLRNGIINPQFAFNSIKGSFRIACGQFEGKWELVLFPSGRSGEAQAADQLGPLPIGWTWADLRFFHLFSPLDFAAFAYFWKFLRFVAPHALQQHAARRAAG